MRRRFAFLCLWVAVGCREPQDPGPGDPSGEGSSAPTAAPVLPGWGTPPTAVAEWDAQLARDGRSTTVLEALGRDRSADHSADRPAALWALGRIGGEAAREHLLSVVRDDRSTATELAVVALLEPPLQTPGVAPEPEGDWAPLAEAVWTRYAVTDDPAQADALLLAIARIGGRRSHDLLAAELSQVPNDEAAISRYRAGMEVLGILCARGHALTDASLGVIAAGLASVDTRIAGAAAYPLGRCGAVSAELLAGDERRVLTDRLSPLAAGSGEEARLAWKALAGLGERPDPIPDSILGADPPGWMVEVEAVRALAGHADSRGVLVERLGRADPAAFTAGRVHVLLEALRGLRPAIDGTPELLVPLRELARRVADARAKATDRRAKALTLAGCELEVLFAIDSGDRDPVKRCADGLPGGPRLVAAMVVETLVHTGRATPPTARADALLERSATKDPHAAFALSALADLDDPRVNATLRAALDVPDPGVRAAAATAIAARSVDASKRDPEVVPKLVALAGDLDNATAIEARAAVIEALGALARSAAPTKTASATPAAAPWLERAVLPLSSDPNVTIRTAARLALSGRPDLLARFDDGAGSAHAPGFTELSARLSPRPDRVAGLRLSTDAGAIEIDFGGAIAPIMQAHLAKLVAERFFNGLTFHRVVPGFVVQGGDPRGDGYGGPGLLVPCEWSNLRYERGTVGIALAGKDTGGSQLFITHAPAPHLDGRYTVIGRVRSDMDVVDRLLPHDVIRSAEVVQSW